MRRNILRAMAMGLGGSVAAIATPALAYNGTNAANYAGTYVLSPNNDWILFDDDCTNFVSQSLYAGGFPMNYNSGNGWWADTTLTPHGYGRTNAWSVADTLRQYLDSHNGGTGIQGPGSQKGTPYTPSNIVTGDVIVYDWDNASNPTPYDHASIQVGQGTDPDSGWIGNLIDEHTTNRGKAIWHLWPYNSRASTTDTKEYHIV